MPARELIYQRCFNHALREAAARCPQCGQYYCRECITEHDDRIICAACLKKSAKPPFMKRQGFAGILRAIQLLIGLFTIWFFFYLFGHMLLSIDSSFHEGTLWQTRGGDPQ